MSCAVTSLLERWFLTRSDSLLPNCLSQALDRRRQYLRALLSPATPAQVTGSSSCFWLTGIPHTGSCWGRPCVLPTLLSAGTACAEQAWKMAQRCTEETHRRHESFPSFHFCSVRPCSNWSKALHLYGTAISLRDCL